MKKYIKYFKIVLGQLYISKIFFKKLSHNFHELTILEKIIYLIFIRWFISKEKRFFFEGSLWVPGQMYIEDRKALYNMIIERKPRYCYEIGTYTGGGSTYFLANAFYKLGSGKIITMENNKELHDRAVDFYKKNLNYLLPHVEFVLGDNFNSFLPYLKNNEADCVFLDGAEDSAQIREQYEKFLPFFKKNALLAMHDWNTEKMKGIKDIILSNNMWQLIKEINPPQSVGFAIVKKNN